MKTLRSFLTAIRRTHCALAPSPLMGEGWGEGEFPLAKFARFATAALAVFLLATPAHAATLTLAPTADAYVQAGTNATKNYGTATDLRIRTSGTTANNYDSYLKFDTTSVNGSISNAKLRIYAKLSASGTVATTAYAVATTTWGETTLTWNNKPARGASLGSVTVNATSYAWKEIDVTSYVQSEYAANRKVMSFAYHDAANSTPYITAYSKNATNVNKPQLLVTYSTNVAPTVSLTAPANGASYTAPASVNLTANATDSDGTITQVAYYNGATLIGQTTSAPYSYTWAGVATGSYTLTAKATDNAGATTTSSPINISVNANQAPSVSLLAPSATDSFTAPATFSIVANAADSDGSITQVEFYNGATLLGSKTQSPFMYDWINVAAGSYTLTAKAYDNANASTTSAPVTITVNAPQVAPGIYYIYADHLNTPRVITDSANKTVWRWDSDPFGTDMPYEDPDGDGIKFTYNLRFPGQYWDQETGLHQNYFRDYDPGTGRYPQFDPIGLAGGINGFGYANQNPLSFIDPLGLEAIFVPSPMGPVLMPIPMVPGVTSTPGSSSTGTFPWGNPQSPPPFWPSWMQSNSSDPPSGQIVWPPGYSPNPIPGQCSIQVTPKPSPTPKPPTCQVIYDLCMGLCATSSTFIGKGMCWAKCSVIYGICRAKGGDGGGDFGH